ncbi:hypothetical protein T459_24022 [Capsicum annuum]|uniref:NB-ARC domain-containing protein n=1 Tax=Capsicum annuum TaxID=4072 RepID=A0A2G2YTX9_CAPAN|nr:hypothetical protein T459_24022 [Capsicum annuum]
MAHASVASLVRTIESLLTSNSPMQSITCDHKDEICTLHEKMISLEVFLKNFEKNNISKEMTDVEVHIKKVANIVEQTIQLRVIEVVSADDENLRRNLCFSGEPKVLPIVGKGGIGKTTLAKEVYNAACICSHFDVCAWATVSQQLDVKEILLSLLHSIRDDKVFTNSEAKLADMLQKSLKVVAGLLKSKKAIEDWESVAKDVNSFVTNDPSERCSRVIGLSYNHLTSILKTCLLYFGIFLEDTEIPAKDANRLPSECQSPSRHRRHFLFERLTSAEIDYFTYEPIHFKLLEILDLDQVRIFSFPLQIPSFIWLRYLALRFLRNPDSFPLQIPPEICSNLIIPSAKAFPATLKKLKLKRTCLSWSYLDMIAEFPSLEVLKLMSNACHGREWYPNVRGFTRLKLLLIDDDHLKYWKDTDDNFLIVERIVLAIAVI